MKRKSGAKTILIAAAVFLSALLFRLWLSDKAWHVDMWSNAAWGEWIHDHGPANFYSNSIWTYAWPTQPPLINSIYSFNKTLHIELLGRMAFTEYQLNKLLPGETVWWLTDFVRWFGYGKVNNEIPFQIGYLVTMKLIPILADLGLAGLIWAITRRLRYAIVYLCSPFSWYVSALWGQYDQLAVFLALLAFPLAGKKAAVLSPVIFLISVLVKPTTLMLAPYYLYVAYKHRRWKIRELAAAGGLCLAVFWLTTAPYTHKNPFEFARYDLLRIVFEKAEPRVSVNSFNLWRIFIGDRAVNSTDKLFVFSWQTWGQLAFAAMNLAAIRYATRGKFEPAAIWTGLFMVSAGGWMFMTGVLERYLFAGIVSGLILSGLVSKLFRYWLALSLIFWLNLYYHWWIPESFTGLKNLLTADADLFTRLPAAVAVIIFGLMVASLCRLPKPKPANSQI